MFDQLTPAERLALNGALRRAAVRFLVEFDQLRDASPAVIQSYGGPTALATDWLMCCVETGQARRELMGPRS